MSKVGKALTGGGSSGGGNSDNTKSWTPNAWQATVLGDASDPTKDPNTVLGNLMGENGYLAASNQLREGSMGLLNNYLNSNLANFDYNNANNIAQGYIGVGQNNLQGLANGSIPSDVMANIQASAETPYKNMVGTGLTRLANAGLSPNSSVGQAYFNDANKTLADTITQKQMDYMGVLGGLNQQLISNAPAGISAAATAQESATQTPLSLLNAGIGAFNTANSVLGQTEGSTKVEPNQHSMHTADWINLGLQVASGFCFPAETEILMEDGSNKPIADVKVGEYVMTISDDEFAEPNKVLEIQEPREEKVFKVVCVDKLGAECPVEASATQPFMNENDEWVELKDLKVGDVLLGVGEVKSVRPSRVAMVYDLRVENNNNYIADGYVAKGKPAKEVSE